MSVSLAKAYVQIVPSAKGMEGGLQKALGGPSQSAGKSAGLNIAGAIKGVLAAAGIGAVLKETIEAGGAMQQSFGGLDTIYGDASAAAKEYATQAATAGISANDYAEQAVSFGAALKQAFGGDTAQAAEAANTAILDMADNSAKFGTDISSVQNAYQGFAKQNYTMLDNLKLGYGGTKEEMSRLLSDAEKLTGVHYDMDNLGDVYSAIHAIQEDLGVAGVAAEEASTTFTGSFGAMKAAATNLMANLSLGNDIGPSLNVLKNTVSTFFVNNLLPMVKNVISQLPTIISEALSSSADIITWLTDSIPDLITEAGTLVEQLGTAIISNAPRLIGAAAQLIGTLATNLLNSDWMGLASSLLTALVNALGTNGGILTGDTSIIDNVMTSINNGLANLLTAAGDIVSKLIEGLDANGPTIITAAGSIVTSILSGLTDGLGMILSKGAEILVQLLLGITDNLPTIIETVGSVIGQFIDDVGTKLPDVLAQGTAILNELLQGIVDDLPEIATAIGTVFVELVAKIVEHLPEILDQGVALLGQLGAGIIQAIPDLIANIPQIFTDIKDKLAEFDWKQLGIDLINGIIGGIKEAASSLASSAVDAVKSAYQGMLDFLHIGSPSKLMRDEVGAMMAAGLGIGFVDGMPADEMVGATQDAFGEIAKTSLTGPTIGAGISGSIAAGSSAGTVGGNVDQLLALLNTYLPQLANMRVVLDSGETVGAMASSMDNTLGNRQFLTARGAL